jgi:hypothetical protein
VSFKLFRVKLISALIDTIGRKSAVPERNRRVGALEARLTAALIRVEA